MRFENKDGTELTFEQAVPFMTDFELKVYRRRYLKSTDHISVMHGIAIRNEIRRRKDLRKKGQ